MIAADERDLGQTDGIYEESPLAGGFPIISFTFLFVVLFVAMMALFRPDLLGQRTLARVPIDS